MLQTSDSTIEYNRLFLNAHHLDYMISAYKLWKKKEMGVSEDGVC